MLIRTDQDLAALNNQNRESHGYAVQRPSIFLKMTIDTQEFSMCKSRDPKCLRHTEDNYNSYCYYSVSFMQRKQGVPWQPVCYRIYLFSF